MQAKTGSVAMVEIGGEKLKNVSALFAREGGGAIELSHYADGLMCRNLFAKFDLLFDYPRQRVGMMLRNRK